MKKFLLFRGNRHDFRGPSELDLFPDVEILEASGQDALLDLLGTDRLDLVIIEYQYWTDGLQALKEVKRKQPICPVIMFTKTGGRSITIKEMTRLLPHPQPALRAVSGGRHAEAK